MLLFTLTAAVLVAIAVLSPPDSPAQILAVLGGPLILALIFGFWIIRIWSRDAKKIINGIDRIGRDK